MGIRQLLNRSWLVTAGCILAVTQSPVVVARYGTEEASAPSRGGRDSGLPEIVVTAQRQSENVQRVPITVTALEAKSLEALGVSGTTDLPSVTPGLILATQFGYAMFHLRGVGTYNNVGGNESSNAFYIDDLYIPDMPAALFTFNGIERIEVLKGPQGTLFGRNATGGLIRVVTREPQSDPAADISVGYANFETVQARAYLTAGSDRAAADLSALYQNQGDGWGRNVFSKGEFFDQRLYAVRTKQRFDLNDVTRVATSLFYTHDWNTYSSGRRPVPGSLGVGRTPYPGFYNIDYDSPAFSLFRGGGASFTLTHEAAWGTFASISGYQRNEQRFEMDQDSTPFPVVAADIEYRNRYFTQELQMHSPAERRLIWLGGLYFLDGETDLERSLLRGTAFSAAGGSRLGVGAQRTASYAAYGQLTIPAGEATRVTGGLRYTTERRQLDAQVSTPLTGVAEIVHSAKRWDDWTWRLSLDRTIAADVMGYVSYNRGFKSGVYNLLTPSNPVVNPETLDAVELGLKMELFDHSTRVNASAFYYLYDNLQLNTAQLGVNYIINAAKATIHGVDVDALTQVAPGLVLRAQAEWLHSRYDSFKNAPAQIPAPGTCTPFPQTTGPLVGGNITCSIDATGNRLTSAPTFTSSIGAQYQLRASFGRIFADLAYYRTSSIYFQPDNRLNQPGYGLLNASVGFETLDGHFEARLWGKNLSNTRYAAFITTSTGDAANPAAPRTFGVTLQAHL